MEELNLRQIQEAMVGNLKFIHEFCEKHGLTYYITYGTLLGAIRHKGFIPWDDDNDIWMPRKDFDKFVELCNNGALEGTPFVLCTREKTKNYPYGIPRLSNMNYAYIVTNSWEPQFDIGIFTDIYPLDNYCTDEEKALELFNATNKINKEYGRWLFWKGKNFFITIPRTMLYFYLRIKLGSDYSLKVNKRLYNKVKEYTTDDDKFVGTPTWNGARLHRYPKNAFKDKVLVDFEGEKFYAPVGWDTILKIPYGNYMELPPVEQRTPYHGYKIYKK